MDSQNHQNQAFSRFIGVDVGKASIAVHDSTTGKTRLVDNTRQAIAAFLADCNGDTMVVCEASGGYEGVLLACATGMGITICRVSANKIKSFIASYGTLSKTDCGDARAIAAYGRERHYLLHPWRAADDNQLKLQALVLRRDDLVTMRTAEKNRLKAPQCADAAGRAVMRSIRALLEKLESEIAAIEKAIATLVKEDKMIGRKFEILTKITGIGTISAAAIIAHMPEIGTCNRRQAASLAGLAPHPRDSGTLAGYRNVRGGRKPLKLALFMPAMVTARGNSQLSAHYKNLIKQGKKPIVAITAIMRKIIVIANAKVRDDIYSKQS